MIHHIVIETFNKIIGELPSTHMIMVNLGPIPPWEIRSCLLPALKVSVMAGVPTAILAHEDTNRTRDYVQKLKGA